MDRDPIPPEVRRFILISVASVPYLEAMLLMREEREREWDAARLAQRLYMNEQAAAAVLGELLAAGIVKATAPDSTRYCYRPNSDELRLTIDQVAACYAKHLLEVTNLIHSKTSKNAQLFADAFKWRKDS